MLTGPRSRRPGAVVLVAGTGTDVGKTWVSARLLEAWVGTGYRVAARKAAQSYQPGDVTDAEVLAAASGAPPSQVCPPGRWYPVPLAPPMAAEALGAGSFTVADLLDELQWPEPEADVGLLETAGGVRSPQADDGDVLDVARILRPDVVVLVAEPGLGAINGVRMAVEALGSVPGPSGGPVGVCVVLNRFDPSVDVHERNRRWLIERCGCDVTPAVPDSIARLAHRLLRGGGRPPAQRGAEAGPVDPAKPAPAAPR